MSDGEESQHEECVPKGEVDEGQAVIEKRGRRPKQERKERVEWMNRGEGNGHSTDYWKRKNRAGLLEKTERLTDAPDVVLWA